MLQSKYMYFRPLLVLVKDVSINPTIDEEIFYVINEYFELEHSSGAVDILLIYIKRDIYIYI